MVDLPTRYYVQKSQTDSSYGPPEGWQTVSVNFDRAEGDAYAKSLERAVLFEEAENVSEMTSTVARVMSAEELRAEGEQTLVEAEIQTRVQFWQKLAEWAEPLVEPGHL